MANRKMLIGGLVAVICLLAVFYFVKVHPNNDNADSPNSIENAIELIGIIDMRQAMKAYPQYQKLDQLKKERNTMALQVDKVRDIQLDTSDPAMDLLAVDDVFRQKKNQKMQQKIVALNQELKKKQQEVEQQFSAAHQAELQEIDDQYLPNIFNLNLKMETLKVTNETKIEIQRQIDGLKREHAQIRQAKDQIFVQKIRTLMQEEQTKAKQRLDAYAADVDRDLQEEVRKDMDAAKTRNHIAMAEKSNELKLGMQSSADMRKSLDDKDQEISILEEKIIQDISGKVAKIALQNKLSVVLTSVQVNVKAMDITELVIKEFKN